MSSNIIGLDKIVTWMQSLSFDELMEVYESIRMEDIDELELD